MLRRLCHKGRWLNSAQHGGWIAATSVALRRVSTTHQEQRTAAAAPSSSTTSASATPSAADMARQAPPIGGPTQPPRHPMELLSYVFQHHPSALRLHRELTIALANGDAAQAADLAGVLAATVRRVVEAREAPAAAAAAAAAAASPDNAGGSRSSDPAHEGSSHDIPAPAPGDVEEAMEKTRQAVLQRAAQQPSSTQQPQVPRAGPSDDAADSSAPLPPPPFWRDPQHLCVTVLESGFETDVPDGEAQDSLTPAGNRAADHEAEQVRILEAYLEKEGPRWKAQKAAIAKIVLDVARSLGVVPEDLQSAEGLGGGQGESSGAVAEGKRLNVLRHSNLVVRGEIPTAATAADGEAVKAAVESELTALVERMQTIGTPLTQEEVQMARYELHLSKSKMRYVVGVHRELQLALDNSEALHVALQRRASDSDAATKQTGTQLFMGEVIRALNEGAESFSANASAQGLTISLEDVAAREAAENPVLPFTFMLKCCLWFDTAVPSSSSSL